MVSFPRLLPWLLAIAAPLLVQMVWLLHNTQLPVSDASGALTAAYGLCETGLQGEWQKFFSDFFRARDWRPVSLYLVELPFCLASGGGLMATIASMTLACTLVSVTYIYRLLRLALAPYPAAMGASLLGLMPIVQWPATYLGLTEAPFLAASLCSFYYLLRCDDFRARKYCVIMAMAAAFCFTLRPIETLFHFLPMLGFVAWQSWRNGRLPGREIYASVTVGFASVSLLLLAGWWPHGLFVLPASEIFNEPMQGFLFAAVAWGVWIVTALLFTFFVLRRQWRFSPTYFFKSVSFISFAVTLWYFAFVTPLVQWVYITNLGELSNIVEPFSAMQKLVYFITATGAIPVLVLVVLALLAQQRLQTQLVALFAVAPLPLLTPFFTCQYSQRKMTLAFTCLLILLLSVALQKGRLQRLRNDLMSCLLLCQLAGATWIGLGYEHNDRLAAMIGLPAAYPDMVTTSPNPHDSLIAFMQESAKVYRYHSIAMPILAGNQVKRLADPFLLQTLAKIHARDLPVYFPHITMETSDRPLHELVGGDTFIVIPDRPLSHSPEEIAHYRELAQRAYLPSDKTAYRLIALHDANQLESEGLHKRVCRVIVPTRVEACIYEFKR